jgi:hypothetical protein
VEDARIRTIARARAFFRFSHDFRGGYMESHARPPRGTPIAITGAHPFVRGDNRIHKGTTAMKLAIRQGLASAAVFGAVLLVLISVDDRVRERFSDLMAGGANGSVSPWGDRAGDLGSALVSAARYQSIENAPLLVFAGVGAVLVVFMLKS